MKAGKVHIRIWGACDGGRGGGNVKPTAKGGEEGVGGGGRRLG